MIQAVRHSLDEGWIGTAPIVLSVNTTHRLTFSVMKRLQRDSITRDADDTRHARLQGCRRTLQFAGCDSQIIVSRQPSCPIRRMAFQKILDAESNTTPTS